MALRRDKQQADAQMRLADAQEKYDNCRANMRALRTKLHDNGARQSVLYEACGIAATASQEATSSAQHAHEVHSSDVSKLRAAQAAELAARQQMEQLERVQSCKAEEERLAKERLELNEKEAISIRDSIVQMEDKLSCAEVVLENRKGNVRAAEQACSAPNASQPSSSVRARSEAAADTTDHPPPKRSRTDPSTDSSIIIPLKTWTTGKIFSHGANDFVRGYPHQADEAYSQHFIMHLDTGNSGHTVISRAAFDFLGLGRTAPFHGRQTMQGVGGHTTFCPVYEIQYTVDSVNLLKQGTIYRRTVKAAVVDSGLRPCDEGYFDLLLNAEDTRKLSAMQVAGKHLRLEILDGPPQYLYDKKPLKTQCRFSVQPQERQNFTAATDIFEQFFGHRHSRPVPPNHQAALSKMHMSQGPALVVA